MCISAAPPLARGLEPAVFATATVAPDAQCEARALKLERPPRDVLVGERAAFSGVLDEGDQLARSGKVLFLERFTRSAWRSVAHTRTGARGRFMLSYTPTRLGREELRVSVRENGARLASAARPMRIEVFRLAGASWYGGGGTMACGGELTSSTLGVANRTLPCGTLVTLRYAGRTIRAPVVDRGPYVEGREFDLTEATKRALGFGDTGEVWTTA